MVVHFIHLIITGIAKLWILSFIIFYLVIELPLHLTPHLTTPRGGHCTTCKTPTPEERTKIKEYTQYFERMLHIDKLWPLNYVDWLFDPRDTTTHFEYDIYGNTMPQRPKGVDISVGNLQIKGSGVLNGDLGSSMSIDPGTPVVNMFGQGIGEMFTFLTSLIAVLMALIAAQRWQRPQPYRVSALPTASSLVDWWQLNASSPLDIAVVRRQVG